MKKKSILEMKIVQGLIGKLETFPFEDHDDVLEGCAPKL